MTNMPKTMLAAFMTEQKKPLVVDEVNLPEKLFYGQVLVKVHYSGICGSQLGEIYGIKGEDRYLPHLLGHEGAGEVLSTGEGVKTVKSGNHVILHWVQGEGIQSEPPIYSWKGKQLNAGFITTFNEYAIVSENRLTVIPDDFDLEIASLFGCAVTTGLGVINNKAKIKIGESIAVLGAGGVGLNMIQGAAMVSANPIIAVDIFDNKLKIAKKLGATHIINSKKSNLEKDIINIIGRNGADVIVDNTGDVQNIELAYRLTAPKGRTILVGVPYYEDDVRIHTLPLHFGKIITGTRGGETKPQIDIPRYLRLYETGKLQLKEIITGRFSLSEINAAIENMRRGEISGRCIIKMDNTS